MKTSSAPASASSLPIPPAGQPGQPGRPTILKEEITVCMCELIRRIGISDSAAGLLAGVSTSSVSRWKQDHPEFKFHLKKARVEFIVPRLEAIGQARRRDGSLDWRAQKWLIEYADPERFGKPSRGRSLKKVKVNPKDVPAPGQVVLTPENLRFLQKLRQEELGQSHPEEAVAHLPKEQGRRRPEFPKTPAEEANSAFRPAGVPEGASTPADAATLPAAQHMTFLPKTPAAQENSEPAPLTSHVDTLPETPAGHVAGGVKAAPEISKIPAKPEKHGTGASRLLERVGRLFQQEAPVATKKQQQQAAKLREAAEWTAFRSAVEAMENAPDLYPDFDQHEEDARTVTPGMWAGY